MNGDAPCQLVPLARQGLNANAANRTNTGPLNVTHDEFTTTTGNPLRIDESRFGLSETLIRPVVA